VGCGTDIPKMDSDPYFKRVQNKSPPEKMWRGMQLFQDRYHRHVIAAQ